MQFFFNKFILTFCDAAEAWQIGIQDPATPVAEGMILFHDYLAFFLVFIGVFVFWLLYTIIEKFNEKANPKPLVFTHSSVLEIVWTIIPAIILIFVAIPSFTLLYSIDEIIEPQLTLKVIGHQWYWSYEYSDFNESFVKEIPCDKGSFYYDKFNPIEFDSYMVPTAELSKGTFRLLEVDNRVVLPTDTHIRLLVTAADVLHSWAIPSFGIKIDATPGRLTQGALFIKRPGVFYGQCSEICGVNHGFMPIVVKAINPSEFLNNWLLRRGTFEYFKDDFLLDTTEEPIFDIPNFLSLLPEYKILKTNEK